MEQYIYNETEWYLLNSKIIDIVQIISIFENKSVALIGNAQSLFDRSYATEIDQHNVVCRLNRGAEISNTTSHGIQTDVVFYSTPTQIREPLDKSIICIHTHAKKLKHLRLDNDTYFCTNTLKVRKLLTLPKKIKYRLLVYCL